jgi:hypothetical protein
MLYDVFIFTLTVAGLVTVLVFSYKIAQSPVYPVGIVRPPPTQQPLLELIERQEVARLRAEAYRAAAGKRFKFTQKGFLIPRDLTEFQIVLPEHAASKEHVWVVPVDEGVVLVDRDSAIEMEVAGHGEHLSDHDKQLTAFEKRLRRLEVESVKKLQEAAEGMPQATQAEIVH